MGCQLVAYGPRRKLRAAVPATRYAHPAVLPGTYAAGGCSAPASSHQVAALRSRSAALPRRCGGTGCWLHCATGFQRHHSGSLAGPLAFGSSTGGLRGGLRAVECWDGAVPAPPALHAPAQVLPAPQQRACGKYTAAVAPPSSVTRRVPLVRLWGLLLTRRAASPRVGGHAVALGSCSR
jgi:hypothetical protein